MSARFTADLEFTTMEGLMDDIDKAITKSECGFTLYNIIYTHWADGVAEVVFTALDSGAARKLAGALADEWEMGGDELADLLESIKVLS